jgi:hypothetical protein
LRYEETTAGILLGEHAPVFIFFCDVALGYGDSTNE